jgi:O-antigen/teichoic acid export membrane protein
MARQIKSLLGLFPGLNNVISGRGMGSELARNGIGSLILKISDVLLSFLIAVILARALGAEGYGVYSYVYALVTLLSIPAQFGLPNLLVRETAKALARQEWGIIQGVWRWAGRITGILTVVLILGTGAVVILWGDQFSHQQLFTMFWGLALVPLIALSALRGAALRGLHRVIQGQIPEQAILPGLLLLFILGAIFLFPATNLSPAAAMGFHVAAAALAFVTGAVLLWRATPPEVRRAEPIYESRLWLASTLPLAFIGGMQLINNRTSILILGLFTDSVQVGIYRVADQMSLLVSFGLMAINMAVAPQFARLHAIGDAGRLQKLATTSARMAFFLTTLVVAAFLLFGKLFLGLVFGAEFIPAYSPLIILACGQLVSSAAGSVAVLLNMTGNEQETARGMTIAAVGNVILNLILIPLWGTIGAAVASAVTLSSWNFLLLVAVRRKLKINSMAFGPSVNK